MPWPHRGAAHRPMTFASCLCMFADTTEFTIKETARGIGSASVQFKTEISGGVPP
jgi:hypothetical protein